MSLSLPPPSRRIDPRRRDSNADGRDKLNLQVARQNVNLCRAHGNGYGHRLPPPSTTTPGVRACPRGRGWAVPAILRIRLGCQPGGPPHFLEGGRPLDVTVLLPWALSISYGCTACRRANVWVLSSVSRRANAREEV